MAKYHVGSGDLFAGGRPSFGVVGSSHFPKLPKGSKFLSFLGKGYLRYIFENTAFRNYPSGMNTVFHMEKVP